MTEADVLPTILGNHNAHLVRSICMMASMLDVEALRKSRAEVDHVDAIGPFIDPTGYMKAMGNVRPWTKFIDALIAFHDAIPKEAKP